MTEHVSVPVCQWCGVETRKPADSTTYNIKIWRSRKAKSHTCSPPSQSHVTRIPKVAWRGRPTRRACAEVLIDSRWTYISVPKVRVNGRVRTAHIAGSPGPASRAANRASASEWALLTCCVGDWPTGQGLRGAQLAQPPRAQQRPHSRISSRPANRAAGRVVFTLGSQLSEA